MDIQMEMINMQVDTSLSAQILAAQTKKSAASEAMFGGTFIDALNAAKKNAANTPAPAAATDKVKSADNAAYAALVKYMKESPAEHLRDKIMKEMGLTDQSLAAMPPAQRSAVEEAVAKKIKEYMLTHNSSPQQAGDASKTMTLLPS
jgi:hypothetical protein